MSIVVRKMLRGDREIWAGMRVKLWHGPSLAEHVGDIDTMLARKHHSGYVALLADREPVGFAERCIREYANGCTEQPVPFLEGIWVDPNFGARASGAPSWQG